MLYETGTHDHASPRQVRASKRGTTCASALKRGKYVLTQMQSQKFLPNTGHSAEINAKFEKRNKLGVIEAKESVFEIVVSYLDN